MVVGRVGVRLSASLLEVHEVLLQASSSSSSNSSSSEPLHLLYSLADSVSAVAANAATDVAVKKSGRVAHHSLNHSACPSC